MGGGHEFLVPINNKVEGSAHSRDNQSLYIRNTAVRARKSNRCCEDTHGARSASSSRGGEQLRAGLYLPGPDIKSGARSFPSLLKKSVNLWGHLLDGAESGKNKTKADPNDRVGRGGVVSGT